MNNFRSRRDGRNARRCAHFHIVQRQHTWILMDGFFKSNQPCVQFLRFQNSILYCTMEPKKFVKSPISIPTMILRFFSWDNLDNFSVWKLSINFPVTKCWSTSCKEDVSYSNPALITVIQIDHKATEIQKGHTWIFLTYLALNAK